jgi:Uma2 family endonuclease
MSTAALHRYTPEEYLALERNAEFKSEYIDGRIIAMSPGVSRGHNKIGGNVYIGLVARTAGRGCEVFIADVKVRFGPGRNYTYPDVVAVCGTSQTEDDFDDILLNPALIVEVLSHSTESYDRKAKFLECQALESLREYVLISQDEVKVEIYSRREGFWGCWTETDLDAEVEFTSVGCRFTLREIYARTRFVPADTPAVSD